MAMDKKIKILYTIPNFKTAGSQYVLLSLFRNIDTTIFDPYICIENYPEAIPIDILKERVIIFKGSEHQIKNVLSFKKVLQDLKIDIVHSWDYKSNYLEAIGTMLAGAKYVYTKKNNAWSKRWFLKSVLSNHIAFNNPDMKTRFFDSFLLKNKISFISHGVDILNFKPRQPLPRETYNIGCVGNIGINKNQLFVVRALKELPKNIHLYLYGKEEIEYKQKLVDYIYKNDLIERVHFEGFVPNKEIPKIFRNLDVFILASFNEGLPVSIIEAMACGIPVLSSDSGGGARFLLDFGNIFNLNSTDELVKKILELYHLEALKLNYLKEKGIKNVVENYTLQHEVSKYENLYKSIMLSN